MPSIRIKNFGPIKEGYTENDGFLDIKKCTVFIGNQGSGKSTVAKVLTTMMWLEKQIRRGDLVYTVHRAWFESLFQYFGLQSYFNDDTEIQYIGEFISIGYHSDNEPPNLHFSRGSNNYRVPKILYIPAERNFLSAVKNAFNMRELPPALFDFAAEYKGAQESMDNALFQLPNGMSDLSVMYQSKNDQVLLVGSDYQVNLLEGSSGYQSIVPLYLVSHFISESFFDDEPQRSSRLTVTQSIAQQKKIDNILSNAILSNEEKLAQIEEVQYKYVNGCFYNIVEEPEQNLYPSSQRAILNSLLEMNNSIAGNKLLINTHSPYIINYLTIAIKAHELFSSRTGGLDSDLHNRVSEVVPYSSAIAGKDVAIYELKDGKIILLPTYEGIPSDNNYLNESLAEANRLFDELLEIEEELNG